MIPNVDEGWSTYILTAIFCVALAIWWWSQKPKNAPPGPTGIPCLGSMIPLVRSMRKRTYIQYLSEQHEKYGPIISIQAGVQRYIHISDGLLMTRLFQMQEFAVRPLDTFPVFGELCHKNPRGLTFGNGESQSEMRKFATHVLRDFGVGQKNIDLMIQSEVSIFCNHLESLAETKNEAFSDVKVKLQLVTTNLVHQLLFGHRREYYDPKYESIIQKLHEFSDANLLEFLENYIPGLEKIPILNQYLPLREGGEFHKLYGALEEYVQSQIEDHRSTYIPGEIRDFADYYLKHETEDKEFYTTENIFGLMVDFIRVGSDIPASALSWAVMHLARKPDLQRELREEIDEVVGGGPLDRRDKDLLVKMQAFINELYRYVTVVSIPALHTVTKPVDVEGYTLLPGDNVIASLYTMHHNKDYWEDPDVFRIDRWLDNKGNLLKHEGHFYPFAVGRRSCIGRQFANTQVMFVLVQLLQNFILEDVEDISERSEQQNSGIIRTPDRFHFKVVKRC